jgi:hypothetical protein
MADDVLMGVLLFRCTTSLRSAGAIAVSTWKKRRPAANRPIEFDRLPRCP